MVSETVQEVPIVDEVLQRYSTDRPAKIANVCTPGLIGDGVLTNIGMTCKGKVTAFSVRLASMKIRTKFVLKGDHMVPDFGGTSSGSSEFDMVWHVPDNMNLYLVVTVDSTSLHVGDCFLVAYDRNGKYYRLPTTNTYEDGKVCQGKYDGYGTSLIDCLIKAYAQFVASPWNADLNDRGGTSGMANSMDLFRFKPLEPDGFEMVPPTKDWTLLSTRINSEFINQHIILV